MGKASICVILPAFNEEKAIGKVIDEIPQRSLEMEGYQVEILVIDNNSTDKTGEIAKAKGARVISEPRQGKGRAVRTALHLTRADFVFLLDADYSYPPLYMLDMLAKLKHGYSAVSGDRLNPRMEKGAMPTLNLWGNQALSLLASILYWRWINDLCSGFWGFKGELLSNLKLYTDGFQLEAELFAQLAKKRVRYTEIPIRYRRREGKTKLHWLVGFQIAKTLFLNRI